MDHKIYGRLMRTDLGVYGTRRFPKGGIESPNVTDPSAIENRAPSTLSFQYGNSNVGVHGQTERWRYQVPRNRKAVVINGGCEISRVVAGGAGTQWNSIILLQRANTPGENGGPVQTLCRVTSTDGAVGARAHELLEGNDDVILFEGDIVTGSTAIQAGNMSVLTWINLIEFNAEERIAGNQQQILGGSFNTLGGGGGVLQSGGGGGGSGFRTIIRVEGGSGPFYTATGWTDLGGGYFGRN